MTVSVNVKSLAVGFLLGAILLMALSAATKPQGRYQVAVTGSTAGFIVIARVDTATGEVVTVKQGEISMNVEPTICLPGK